MKGINRMNNHNYTIEFVKGDRADIISQFKKMDSYCLLNNLFKVIAIHPLPVPISSILILSLLKYFLI